MAISGIKETDKDHDSYEIKWGDTLSQIARDRNTTVASLAEFNGIKDPDKILAGATILVPAQEALSDSFKKGIPALPDAPFFTPPQREPVAPLFTTQDVKSAFTDRLPEAKKRFDQAKDLAARVPRAVVDMHLELPKRIGEYLSKGPRRPTKPPASLFEPPEKEKREPLFTMDDVKSKLSSFFKEGIPALPYAPRPFKMPLPEDRASDVDYERLEQIEKAREKDPRWVKVPIEGEEEVWKKLKLGQTAEYRDYNNNGIEDRSEGIYLPRDFEDPSRVREEPTINIDGRDVPLRNLISPDTEMDVTKRFREVPPAPPDSKLWDLLGRSRGRDFVNRWDDERIGLSDWIDEHFTSEPSPEKKTPSLFEPPEKEKKEPLFTTDDIKSAVSNFFSDSQMPEVQAASFLSPKEDKEGLSSTAIPSPIKYVWSSLWGKGSGQTRTGADVGQDVVQVTKDAKDNAISAGRSHVHYEDYGETNRGLPVAALVGAAKDASGRKLSPEERQSLSSQRRKAYPKNLIGAARLVYDLFTDPKVKAALTIGGFSIRGNEGAEYLEDVFNFNTANSGDKDWYAFIRKVLSNSGLMPIDDNEGIKTRIELS